MERLLCRVRPRTAHTYIYNGKQVQVFDDARTCFSILRLFEDEELFPETKINILLKLLFPDAAQIVEDFGNLDDLLSDVLWTVCSLDIDGSHADECGGKEVIDWKADEPYIRASVFAAYGRSWDEICENTTLKEVIDLVSLCPSETPIGQALYYRTAKPPKETKYNHEQVKDFKKRQEFWRIKKNHSKSVDSVEAQNGAAYDVFRSLERKAVSARG